MTWLGLVMFLAPAVIPGTLGAWFVLARPERRRVAGMATLGGAAACVAAFVGFRALPWVHEQGNLMTRDHAAVAAAEPYVFGLWALLVAIFFFGFSGWLAGGVRKGGALFVVTGLIAMAVVPFTLFVATLMFGCFFAGACF